MKNINTWWNLINSIFIGVLYFIFLFSYGELPQIKKEIQENKEMIQRMDYFIQNFKYPGDTIVINNYYNTPKLVIKKKK